MGSAPLTGARWHEEIQLKPVVADERSAIRTLITNLEQGEQKKGPVAHLPTLLPERA